MAGVLATVVVVISVFYLSTYLLQTKYAPLFSDLETQEAGAITEKLKSSNIKYQVTDQGRTIEVPKEQVYDLRMQLANEGVLPGGGSGFELFDQTKLAQTDFEQQVVYQRALQDELKRSIQSLDAVEQARVHLVLPEKSVFINTEREVPASASVVLKLKPMIKLEQGQVKGINELLVGSVEGLTADNIHIIDTNGNSLNDFLKTTADPQLAANSVIQQQIQMRDQIQQDLERRIKQFLTPVYGPGKSVAMVAVELDFTKAQTTRQEVLPGQVLSEQSERASGTNGGIGGLAGTTSQMPGTDYPGVLPGDGGEYNHQSDTTNYQLGEEVTVVEQPPGAITRISTSVIVDSTAGPVDELAIQQLVGAAIGYEPERGDEVTVQTMSFDSSLQDDLDEDETPGISKELYRNLALAAGIFLIALILLLLRRRKRRREAEEEALLAESLPEEILDFDDEEAKRKQTLDEIAAAAAKDPANDVKAVAKQSPDDVAQIIKLWLKE